MPANTKTMIAETFFNMAKGKSIDKITVTDLVERCKISRQTFYYHFKDIMDVLEWGMERRRNGPWRGVWRLLRIGRQWESSYP